MVVRAACIARMCCSDSRIASSRVIFVGAFVPGVGAAAGGVGGGNGGIFCPWPTAKEGSARSTVAHANPFFMEKPHVSRRDKPKRANGATTNEGKERTTRGKGARAEKWCAQPRSKAQTRLRQLPAWSKLESSPCSA